jgi:hypothetical protein
MLSIAPGNPEKTRMTGLIMIWISPKKLHFAKKQGKLHNPFKFWHRKSPLLSLGLPLFEKNIIGNCSDRNSLPCF